MPNIEVTDEAIINSPSSEVFKAILNEAAGKTNWWMPHWESKLRGRIPINEVGAVFEMTVHRTGKPRLSGKVTEIIQDKFIKTELSGDFEGTGEWTFEPLNGKTRLQYRWDVKPKKPLFRLISPFMDLGKSHSEVMQRGFESLEAFLINK